MVIFMMNYIWSFMIIASLAYSIIFNKLDIVTNSMFEGASDAVELTILMFGLITLWNGIMNILSNTSIMGWISKIITPIISRIFSGLDKKSKAYNYICLNFTANLLGLGNASTPLGLNAVRELENKKDGNKHILKLILINTAALQLIPSTVIGLRSMLGSQNPNSIILHIWICSLISITTALFSYKLLSRRK